MPPGKPRRGLTFVYTLNDPRTDEVRYVGITNHLENRYMYHLTDTRNSHRGCWIGSLLKMGLQPVLHVLEMYKDRRVAAERERYWIAKFREDGFKLTNLAPGGEGGQLHVMTEAEKEHLRQINLGKTHSDETKEKCRQAGIKAQKILHERGYRQSRESIEKRAAKMRGRPQSPESNEKRRKTETGRKQPRTNRVEAAKKAWDTRRAKWGPLGHS